jgi:hypothetical protein
VPTSPHGVLAVACLAMGAAAPLLADHPVTTSVPGTLGVKRVDLCAIASADTLQALLQTGIQHLFPIPVGSDGAHLEISSPSIEQVSCPHMSIKLRAELRYRQGQGRLQSLIGGSMVLSSPIIGDLEFSDAGDAATVTAANLRQGIATVIDPQITSLAIEHAPAWVEPLWMRACLIGQHADWGCRDVIQQMRFNVTQLAQLYLQQGSSL